MCTSRPGWQTICFRKPLYKQHLYNIDVNLVDVLEVNKEKQVGYFKNLIARIFN